MSSTLSMMYSDLVVTIEELGFQCHSEDILDGFDALMVKSYAKAHKEHPHRKHKRSLSLFKNATMPAESARPSTGLVCQSVLDKELVNQPQIVENVEILPKENNGARMPMLLESGRLINMLQEKDMMEKRSSESNVNVLEPDTDALRQEILELKRDNGKLGKLLKESQEKLNIFSNERILWEQKKLSEMSNFNAFKESEINRLRRTINDLTEQMAALQEEVRRYERFLHSELNANDNSTRKVNIPRGFAAEKPQSLDSEHYHNEQSSNNLSFQDKNSQGRAADRVRCPTDYQRALLAPTLFRLYMDEVEDYIQRVSSGTGMDISEYN